MKVFEFLLRGISALLLSYDRNMSEIDGNIIHLIIDNL